MDGSKKISRNNWLKAIEILPQVTHDSSINIYKKIIKIHIIEKINQLAHKKNGENHPIHIECHINGWKSCMDQGKAIRRILRQVITDDSVKVLQKKWLKAISLKNSWANTNEKQIKSLNIEWPLNIFFKKSRVN